MCFRKGNANRERERRSGKLKTENIVPKCDYRLSEDNVNFVRSSLLNDDERKKNNQWKFKSKNIPCKTDSNVLPS